MSTMEQWTTLMDGIEALQVQTVPVPVELKDDEVLVKIHAVSINNRDVRIINGDFKGRYATPSHPAVPCSDASGQIVKVGGPAAAQKWQEGDRVIGLVRPTHKTGATKLEHFGAGLGFPQAGVLAAYRVFAADGLVKVPEYMSFDEAATLPIAAITAWMALNWDRPVGSPRRGSGITVLLQGTGGVCIAALQTAAALGLTTIITSSSDAKLQRAKDLGATHGINYKTTPDWAAQVLQLTQGQGADLVIETGGPATLSQSIRAVAEGGVISAVGILTGASGDAAQMAVSLELITRNAALKGINIGPKDRVEEMVALYEEREIRPVIDQVFGFGEVKEAMKYVKDGSHFGKVVIKVG